MQVDCVQSDWSEWICDAKCDSANPVSLGQATRIRSIVSDVWDAINVPCLKPLRPLMPCRGSGTLVRRASLLQRALRIWFSICGRRCTSTAPIDYLDPTFPYQALNNGQSCGALTETTECANTNCAVNCVQGGWSEWTCNAACTLGQAVAKGYATRTRPTLIAPLNNGAQCGVDAETQVRLIDVFSYRRCTCCVRAQASRKLYKWVGAKLVSQLIVYYLSFVDVDRIVCERFNRMCERA